MTHQCPYQSTHTPRPTINRATRTINGKPVCDKCGKELDNGEDKVYCPICGTPVHKSCWDEDPVCPNESRHAEGFDWEKVNKKPEQSNPAKEFYARRTLDPAAYENFQDMIENHPILSPESGEELTCRGVKQKELIHFLGMNNFSTPRFFTLFMNMANGGKVLSLNLSAWFFVPLYHYYRRMTGPAVILTLATFILTIPSLMYQVLFFREMSTEMPDLQFGTLVTVTSYIMIVFRVVLLLFNDYFYMRWSVNKILALRERYKDAPADEYYEALERKGNPKMLFVLGGISLMLFLVYILNIFISYTGIV